MLKVVSNWRNTAVSRSLNTEYPMNGVGVAEPAGPSPNKPNTPVSTALITSVGVAKAVVFEGMEVSGLVAFVVSNDDGSVAASITGPFSAVVVDAVVIAIRN